FSLRRDNFTETQIGLTQQLTRPEKRRLRRQRGQDVAAVASAELESMALEIRRDTALAWLEVWWRQRAAELAMAAATAADLQVQAMDIAYTAGRTAQADVLTARVTVELLRDDVADLEQKGHEARNELSRWIGSAADRPVPAELPAWTPPPALPDLLGDAHTHPMLTATARQAAVAADEVGLARAAYKPDWTVGVYYANRLDYADFVGVNFTVGLPMFTADRQDRSLAAGLEEKNRAEQLHEDLERRHAAQIRQNYSNWQRLQERIVRYDSSILPQSLQRTEAARLAWQSGQGSLAAVLDARRVDLQNQLRRLELKRDAAAARITLRYLAGEQP
ncbi:MAG: TolC family protein, partial [Gammaproteobacteria bacterium]